MDKIILLFRCGCSCTCGWGGRTTGSISIEFTFVFLSLSFLSTFKFLSISFCNSKIYTDNLCGFIGCWTLSTALFDSGGNAAKPTSLLSLICVVITTFSNSKLCKQDGGCNRFNFKLFSKCYILQLKTYTIHIAHANGM